MEKYCHLNRMQYSGNKVLSTTNLPLKHKLQTCGRLEKVDLILLKPEELGEINTCMFTSVCRHVHVSAEWR